MTEDEKLDLILREYSDRLSRHHPEGTWEKIAMQVTGSDNPKSSAYGIYINKLFQDGMLERDINGDVVASHKGKMYSYVRETKRTRKERVWTVFTRITAIVAFIFSAINMWLVLKKESPEVIVPSQDTVKIDSQKVDSSTTK